MKLSSLLNEKLEKERVLEILNNDIMYHDFNIYRGMSSTVSDKFFKKTIRKNRVPRSTPSVADALAEAARRSFDPSIPSRWSSAFATTNKRYAKKYGKVMYVFHRHNANIAYWFTDTYVRYFRAHNLGIYDMLNNKTISYLLNKFPELKQLLIYWTNKDADNIVSLMSNKYNKTQKQALGLFNELDEIKRQALASGNGINSIPHYTRTAILELDGAVNYIHMYLDRIKSYIENANRGFNPKMNEMLIEDDYIYVAEPKWFDDNFVRRNDMWKIK